MPIVEEALPVTTQIVLAIVALLLIFLLLRMRRRRLDPEQVDVDGGAPRRGLFRRDKGDSEAAPAPMPLATATNETAATETSLPDTPEPEPGFPAGTPLEATQAAPLAVDDGLDLGAIPSLEELAAEPAWPEPGHADPQADESLVRPEDDVISQPAWPEPGRADPQADESLVRPEDDVISQPGWPAPGEVGPAWSTDEPLPATDPEPEPEEAHSNGGPPPEEPAPWQPALADQGFDPATGWTTASVASEAPEPAGEPLQMPEGPEVTPFPAAAIPTRSLDELGEDAPTEQASTTGRFALGGYALQPGQQAVSGVTFPQPLPWAPEGWTHAPSEGPPRTIELDVNGTINCEPTDVEVIAEPGFAPTQQGFTLRLSARAAGPFMASGTFRVV